MPQFDIVSVQSVKNADEKGFVSYKLCIRQDDSDPNPAFIERRYTHFLELYNGLRKEQPSLMGNVDFPKKVMMGNFNEELINTRKKGFESLLDHIAKESRLREAQCTIDFFQNLELEESKKALSLRNYDTALPILEKIFTLLNKIYTDRSPAVIIALCRLVACGINDSQESPLAACTERWANLALRRFDGVSDSDLLSLYIPLMKACIIILKTIGKDCATLESTLDNLKRKGMRVDNADTLKAAIEKYDSHLKG